MRCSRCRREVPEYVRSCPYCGKRLARAKWTRRSLLALGLGAAAAALLGLSAVQFRGLSRQSAASPALSPSPDVSQSAPRADPSPSPSMAPAQTADAERESSSLPPAPSTPPEPTPPPETASAAPGPTPTPAPSPEPTPTPTPTPEPEPSSEPTPVPTPTPEPGHPPADRLDEGAWSGKWVFSDAGGSPGHYYTFDFGGGLVLYTDAETGAEVRNPMTVVDGATIDEYTYGKLSSRYVLRGDGTIARIYYYYWSDPPYDAAWTATLVRWDG